MMKPNKKTKAQKLEELMQIINSLDESRLEALLTLLEHRPLKTYEFPESELCIVAESFERYGRGEVGGMSAEESVRKLTEHLHKIRKKK
jgi:hypothetical protein